MQISSTLSRYKCQWSGVGRSQYLCYFLGLNALCHSYIELPTSWLAYLSNWIFCRWVCVCVCRCMCVCSCKCACMCVPVKPKALLSWFLRSHTPCFSGGRLSLRPGAHHLAKLARQRVPRSICLSLPQYFDFFPLKFCLFFQTTVFL